MTFSLLALDPETGAIGGIAATGSYCVGAWVLRGSLAAGMSASQGASPSTFWGEGVLTLMQEGSSASDAVSAITTPDTGRDWRQLSALDLHGQGGAFTGAQNTPEMGSRVFDGGVAAGNMLSGQAVLDAMVATFQSTKGAFDARLITALKAGEAAGSDSRGLFSAAMLVLHPDRPPLSLRIDYHEDDPISALVQLHNKATTGDYGEWAAQVPVMNDKERRLD